MFLIMLHFCRSVFLITQSFLPVFKLFTRLNLIFPMMIMLHITRDVKHPGFEVALSPEEMAVLHDSEKGILYQIFT